MLRPWFLRVHRWLALAFCLPLATLIVTGLILSFEPIAQTVVARPGPIDAGRLDALLARHDPASRARGVSILPYEGRVLIQSGGGPDGAMTVDGESGEVVQPGGLSGAFRTARRLHEHLILDLDWLVTASTMAMLALIAIGLAMGWPRLRNTLSGWHQAVAWIGLPLLVASPLTGLLMAFGVTFTAPPASPARAAPLPLRDAVQVVAREKDLSGLIWIRARGGRMLARLNEGGRFTVYAIGPGGLAATPANWPRLLHEGNYAGAWSGAVNVAISLAFVLLLATGVWIWGRRRLKRGIVTARQPLPA